MLFCVKIFMWITLFIIFLQFYTHPVSIRSIYCICTNNSLVCTFSCTLDKLNVDSCRSRFSILCSDSSTCISDMTLFSSGWWFILNIYPVAGSSFYACLNGAFYRRKTTDRRVNTSIYACTLDY